MVGQLTADRSEHRPVGGSGMQLVQSMYGYVMSRVEDNTLKKRDTILYGTIHIKRRLGGVEWGHCG